MCPSTAKPSSTGTIRVESVTVRLGGSLVLSDVSLTVAPRTASASWGPTAWGSRRCSGSWPASSCPTRAGCSDPRPRWWPAIFPRSPTPSPASRCSDSSRGGRWSSTRRRRWRRPGGRSTPSRARWSATPKPWTDSWRSAGTTSPRAPSPSAEPSGWTPRSCGGPWVGSPVGRPPAPRSARSCSPASTSCSSTSPPTTWTATGWPCWRGSSTAAEAAWPWSPTTARSWSGR